MTAFALAPALALPLSRTWPAFAASPLTVGALCVGAVVFGCVLGYGVWLRKQEESEGGNE